MTETMTRSDEIQPDDIQPGEIQRDETPPPDQVGEETARPIVFPLRRNKAFQILWAGSAASALGISVADVGYPLAILGVTRSPADAGLFAAMQTVGQILSGLPAGHLVDRRSPRMLLIVAETGRALVTALVAAALIMGWLTLPLLLIAAVLLGAGQPVVSAARLLMIRTVVPKEQLTRAMTQDEVRINGSELAGPPIGGALYGLNVLAHAVPFLFTIGSFLMSLIAGIMVKVEPDRSQAAPGQPAAKGSGQPEAAKDGGMLAGVKSIWTSPILRVTTMLLAAINSLGAGLSLITVVILRDQAVSSTQIGLALGAASIGGLAGAALVRPLHKLRPGALMIMVASAFVPLLALLAVPFGPWWMAGLLFVAMLGVPSVRVLVDVLILRQAPPAERGRVVSAVMTLLTLGMPAGLALTGLLLQYLSAQTAVLIMAGLLGVAVLIGASRPEVWKGPLAGVTPEKKRDPATREAAGSLSPTKPHPAAATRRQTSSAPSTSARLASRCVSIRTRGPTTLTISPSAARRSCHSTALRPVAATSTNTMFVETAAGSTDPGSSSATPRARICACS